MPIDQKLHHGPRLSRRTIDKLKERDLGIIKVLLVYVGAILLLIHLLRKY